MNVKDISGSSGEEKKIVLGVSNFGLQPVYQ